MYQSDFISMNLPGRKVFKRVCAGISCLLVLLFAEYAWSNTEFTNASNEFGVLVMAHGGSQEWNQGVLSALEPLPDQVPLEVAFGMADAVTLQEAVSKLEARGVKKIGVVRLFISGESWFERTQQILGLRPGAPAPSNHHTNGHNNHDHGHSMEFWRISTDASFALSTQGLAEDKITGKILVDRARELSRNPEREDVLILAHGPGDDEENERWLTYIDTRAKAVRDAFPFRKVQVMTLREDWPEKREAAEHQIRNFIESAHNDGDTVIVIPFRVHGFGPYAKVLDGLDYIANGKGLIPHPNITQWISQQIRLLQEGPFQLPVN